MSIRAFERSTDSDAFPSLANGRLPRRAGISLKPEHFRDITRDWPEVGFFEVHAENYFVAGGPFHHYLGLIRDRYALSIHGVGLSIGGETPLDGAHLDALKVLLERYAPHSFSEHLAWSSHAGHYFNDLLPVVYTPQSLQRVCAHIDQVQTHLGRHMLLENPATYVEYATSTLDEPEFMREIIQRSGCGLLLDVNNVYVTCINHGRDPRSYLEALPLDAVGEIHLAGHACEQDAAGAPLLIDSHDRDVADTVWNLYEHALTLCRPQPTLIERDGNIPALPLLLVEAAVAETRLCAHSGPGRVNL